MKVAEHFHLTYCSNIHAGESWPEVRNAIGAALPEIRRTLAVEGPFAIGLRLSARAADALTQPAALAELQTFLRDGTYYVPTINGFPYGAFHGTRVKEQVYLPDWRSEERVRYTNQLASILAALLDAAPEIEGSVSTVPGAFKSEIRSEADARLMADRMRAHAMHLARLYDATGRTILLAIEPEPACFIETIDEAIDFFDRFLNDELPRRYLGICFDTCHMAVEFEDAAGALARLRNAGIRVPKVQVSSALRVSKPAEGSRARQALARFAEDTYLHQVVEQRGDALARYIDLPEALASLGDKASDNHEWRVHFHVPVFLAAMNEFHTTQSYIIDVLSELKRTGDCRYLEVETYTWDVLPPEYRTLSMHQAIARELSWVRFQLEQ